MIRVRPYDPASDPGALAGIFHAAVQGASDHYSQAQRDDWSAVCPTESAWRTRLEGLTTVVATEDGVPVGFMSMDISSGLLDLAFVLPSHARRGVGGQLYDALMERAAAAGLTEFDGGGESREPGLSSPTRLASDRHALARRGRGAGDDDPDGLLAVAPP